jgi:DNA repair protein RadC
MRKIRDLPANEHPREKLLEEGAMVPADHELLAIILGKDSQKNE